MHTPHRLRSPSFMVVMAALSATVPACKVDKSGIVAGGGGAPGPGIDARPDSPEKRAPMPDGSLDGAAPGAGGNDGPSPVEASPIAGDAADAGGDDATPLSADASVMLADAAADVGPGGSAERCASPLSLPVPARRLPSAPRSDDITFDREGHFVTFDQRSIVRMERDGSTQLLVANLIGTKGGALRALPTGDIYIADFEQDRVFVRDGAGQVRTLPTAVDNPMKMVRGPAGALYITSKQGAVSRVVPPSGAVTTLVTTSFEVGGLTFSPDYRTLYVGAISNDTLQAFDVRADGSLGPARLWKGQIPRAQALATDECGSVYVVSEGDSRIRRITASGSVDTIADLPGVYAWSLSFGSGQQGWSAQSMYVHEAASGRLHELPLPYAGQAAPSSEPVE
jgi:hypothetical protein